MDNTKTPSFEDSLKTLETENFFDRTLYRPCGYRIALALRHTGITPNAVSIISIFFGVAAGILFFPDKLWINLVGFALLVIANTLDCVDGQLARLTGIKSPVGRILDGVAGDLWFVAIYSALALRLTPQFGGAISWILVALAGASNLLQANIVDYYKTLHLYFISLKKGAEFQTVEQVRSEFQTMKGGINRLLFQLYLWYTILQTKVTPRLQDLLQRLHQRFGADFPPEVRLRLRSENLKLIPHINLLTFNWRSVVLLIALVSGQVWIYPLWEVLALNVVLFTAVGRHERMCKNFRE